jgi:hypothetical protein
VPPTPATASQQQIAVVDLSQSYPQFMSTEEFRQLGVPGVGYIRPGTMMLDYPSRFIICGADGIPVVQAKDLSEVLEFAVHNQMMLLPVH